MKLLIVSDIPPCSNYTAGLVLDQICRFMPRGSVAVANVRNPELTDAVLTADLDWVPIEYLRKPREHGRVFNGRGKFLNPLASFALETYHELLTCRRLTEQIVRFGRDFGADTVLAVLQGQTEIRIARPIAAKLGARLYTMAWDPLSLWLDGHEVNRFSQRRVYRQYRETIQACEGFGAMFWAMAEEYGSKFEVRAVPLVLGLNTTFAKPAATAMHSREELILGAGGKVYPHEIWRALIAALQSVNWTIAGRKVRIRILARESSLPWEGAIPVEFVGWHSQKDAVRMLSETDLLFCPYWLDKAYAEVTRLSFPSKLVTYMATGRPVLFLGPEDASPARFLRENDAGLMCHSDRPEAIVGQLQRLCEQPGFYAQLARNGREAFDRHLTLAVFRRRFAELLQVPEESLEGYYPSALRAA
jgi:hypothetical protein